MRKGLLAISLVLLLSLAIVFPSCNPTTGTIEVKATLDTVAWTGAVSYTLTPATGTATSGSSVDKSFTLEAGTWTCAYVTGGPAGASLVSITPSATQTLAAGDTKTFTLNFQSPVQVDASVTFLSWSINGTPVPPGVYWVGQDTVIDATYTEGVSGNGTGPVNVHQTAKITVHNIGIEGEMPGPTIVWHVLNSPGAIKTDPPSDISNQQATLEGNVVAPCTLINLPYCEDVHLDAECDLEQDVGTTYTKSINWVRLKTGVVILDTGDSIFETEGATMLPFQMFTLVSSACVEVGEGFVDTDPSNDCCIEDPATMITIGILPPA